MLILISIITAFVLLSGLLAMVDAAVLSVSRAEVEEAVLQKHFGAQSLQRIKKRITQALVVIVILTNAINILGPILVGYVAANKYGNSILGLIAAILTFATIIFSEIIPKSLGSHYAPFISRISAPVILGCVYLLYPLVLALEWASGLFKSGTRKIGTEAQICSLAALGRREGYIEQDEGQLIQQVFLLNDRVAKDIMTPLPKVTSFQDTDLISKTAQSVARKQYSRYPVFGDSPEEIKGIVLCRDILLALADGKGEQELSTLLRKALIVPAEKRSDELLLLFRQQCAHIAVVQENKTTLGIVTLEDVLEELVGEIEDEKDLKNVNL